MQHRQALFEAAVAEATQGEQRLLWYPHAWLFGYLKSKAELLSAAAASTDDARVETQVGSAVQGSLQCCAQWLCSRTAILQASCLRDISYVLIVSVVTPHLT